jgi:hypothetical protein
MQHGASPVTTTWGWKEPNTHIVIDRILERQPDLKFIYVRRQALDMALSSNQNQLKLWGEHFLQRAVTDTPSDSLSYWCATHRRMDKLASRMGENYHALDYDALCQSSYEHISKLLAFLGEDFSDEAVEYLASFVQPPKTVGRGQEVSLAQFDPADLRYLEAKGLL